LTAAQSTLVDGTGSLGVAAVDESWGKPGHAGILRSMLERTGLFRMVVLLGSGAPSPDYVTTIRGRCGNRRGGFIPVLPILTLGIVPQFTRMDLGYTFALRQVSTGREIVVPCEIESVMGFGWLPALMNILPGWSLTDPEDTPSFSRRLAYAIASRHAARP
jgi:hypothetical protein